ncbi:cob(I)yrinic acid a,c-diamide adenosyltransferase [Kordiimonas pumila]|uniref:Corrinoid adenosyltransferase n=1 Tax=Kordiimonas pumila TaxID=2161677 RepID=A0ABV7D1J2_9PROT|nr:cob(I)yrinic acid a,c-diamide adenosyltransferase [Kordiimonas pumila]
MVKLGRIYTRSGDTGKTGLVGGTRISKASARIEAVGTVDEANATIGVARLHTNGDIDEMLARIQNDMFDLGSDLANPREDFSEDGGQLRITAGQVTRLEKEIDSLNSELAPLTSFTLPGGSPASAHLHIARTVTRRAERCVITLSEQEAINIYVIKYLNRLSDHLFVLTRYLNNKGADDILWIPGASRKHK